MKTKTNSIESVAVQNKSIKIPSLEQNDHLIYSLDISPPTEVMEVNRNDNCLSHQEILNEFEDRRLYDESLGSYSRHNDSTEMPEYWYYSIDTLLRMSEVGDVTARYFAGIKLMYQSVDEGAIKNYFDLPVFINEESNISQYDSKKMNHARQLLYDAAIEGKIYAMQRILISYDLEKYFLINEKKWDKRAEQEYQKKRYTTYFVLLEPYDTKFGTLDLRPFHRDHLPAETEVAINNAIVQFNEERNLKGLSPLMIKGYPQDWQDRHHCNTD